MKDCMSRFDSLIFDMDGTLWDAVDSYVKVWDATFEQCGRKAAVTRSNLIECMGLPITEIYRRLVGNPDGEQEFLQRLAGNEDRLMLGLGGTLYPGVKELIPELARHYKLFMLSNCSALGLPNFLEFTGLKPYFTDSLSYGENHQPKDVNIRLLAQRHSLAAPLYIGDTEGDCRSAHAAGVPMMWVSYGFGTAPDADLTAGSFAEVAQILLDKHIEL
jgi:phosphoglycolate phosphatase